MNKIVYFILIAALVAQISAAPADEPAKKEADAAKKEADAGKDKLKDAADAGKDKVKAAADAAKGAVDGAEKPHSPPPAAKPLGIVQQFGKIGADMMKMGEDTLSTAFGLPQEAATAPNPFNPFSWFGIG